MESTSGIMSSEDSQSKERSRSGFVRSVEEYPRQS